MLVFEGADALGKTTAARRVCELAIKDGTFRHQYGYPIRYEHMSRPIKTFNFSSDYRDMISRYAVMDRFHLGALVWHDSVMDCASLKMVEGWLRCVGSVIVIFYAADEAWYSDWLKEQSGPQMFSIDELRVANRRYMDMVYRDFTYPVDYDYAIDISKDFPTEEKLIPIVADWFKRIEAVNTANTTERQTPCAPRII